MWDDLFLDLDPVRGLAPGERRQNALINAMPSRARHRQLRDIHGGRVLSRRGRRLRPPEAAHAA